MGATTIAPLVAAMLLSAAIIPLSQTAFAQTTTTISLPSAGLLPDNALYKLKTLFEDLGIAFTFDNALKANRHLDVADVRTAEAVELLRQNKTALANQAVVSHREHVAEALDLAESIPESEKRLQVLAEATEVTSKAVLVLEQVIANAPDAAKPGLENALEQVKISRDNAREKRDMAVDEIVPDNNTNSTGTT